VNGGRGQDGLNYVTIFKVKEGKSKGVSKKEGGLTVFVR